MEARASHRGVMQGLEACIALARDPELRATRNPDVSSWSVHEQVEHLLLADRGIVRWIGSVLDEPRRAERPDEPSEWGRRILATGVIPRGRGQAPDGTHPRGATGEDLIAALSELLEVCRPLADRMPEIEGSLHTLPHPSLGAFTPSEWLRFLHVHHLHHARIIDDILGETAGRPAEPSRDPAPGEA